MAPTRFLAVFSAILHISMVEADDARVEGDDATISLQFVASLPDDKELGNLRSEWREDIDEATFGVSNVAIWLESDDMRDGPEHPCEIHLDEDGLLQPKVSFLHPNQELILFNESEGQDVWSAHTRQGISLFFPDLQATPQPTTNFGRLPLSPEILIFQSVIKRAENRYIIVSEYVSCAVTDASGSATLVIPNEGVYRVVIWHPMCGYVRDEASPLLGAAYRPYRDQIDVNNANVELQNIVLHVPVNRFE